MEVQVHPGPEFLVLLSRQSVIVLILTLTATFGKLILRLR
jgi:hypothetical protein